MKAMMLFGVFAMRKRTALNQQLQWIGRKWRLLSGERIVMHRIKNVAAISLRSFLIISCATARKDCPLVGRWRSNEKATLEQMEKYGNLTEEQRNAFSNFFGKLTLEYTCSKVTSYYKGSLVTKDMKSVVSQRYLNNFSWLGKSFSVCLGSICESSCNNGVFSKRVTLK
ncbi:MAG: hypothetical protein ABSG44_07815, partial [Thermodesulfobacteriota bacterium]